MDFIKEYFIAEDSTNTSKRRKKKANPLNKFRRKRKRRNSFPKHLISYASTASIIVMELVQTSPYLKPLYTLSYRASSTDAQSPCQSDYTPSPDSWNIQ
jgi:hypothetical protein